MIVQVRINVEPALAMNRAILRQIPFATHKAVDRTIKQAQSAIQDHLGAVFTLRRPDFVKRTIKITQFSTKQNPTATLSVDPARNVLEKFETGGLKLPHGGRNLAIPLEARAQKGAIVPKALRPASLGGKAFKLKTKSGKTILVERIGKRARSKRRVGPSVQGRDPNLRVWYLLQPSVPIRPSLHFVDIAQRVAMQQWPLNAREAMQQALATARP